MRLIDLIAPAAPPVCVGCGAWAGAAEPLCGGCRARVRWMGDTVHDGVWAPVAYAGPARAVVAALKFRGAVRAADVMAAAVCAAAPAGWLDAPGAALVPVPLHPSRRRRRGFNQAERLAAAVGRRSGLAVCDCLERSGSPATQMGLGREERLGRIAGSVRLRGDPPASVVLIDDVTTTGATLAACAAALSAGGHRQVRSIAYARTPGR